MANAITQELRGKTDTAWAKLTRLVQGMESYLDRADAPGEWTARETLCHLVGSESPRLVDLLRTFSRTDYPTFDLQPADTAVTPEREEMTLAQLVGLLDTQRTEVYAYLDSLPECELTERKLRIPLFKQFMGTDEISLARFVGAMFDFHWNDHVSQLAKIRKAVGLAEAK
jgi:DinB family protein